MKKQSQRLLRNWRDHTIYEGRMIDGCEAMLKVDKLSYYAFNLREAFFLPEGIKDKKLLEKLKQIVVPELKSYYKRLSENQS